MNTTEIQKRLDVMPAAMSAKGLRMPEAKFSLESNATFRVWLAHCKTRDSLYADKYNAIKGGTILEALDAADAYITALPSPDERRHAEFMGALASVIDLGRENGIDVAYINPLTEAMKRLSENALTYQK